MATLKGESAFAADDAMAQYQQYQEEFDRIAQRQMAKFDEGRARSEKLAILRHSQTTPYRTKDRNTPG